MVVTLANAGEELVGRERQAAHDVDLVEENDQATGGRRQRAVGSAGIGRHPGPTRPSRTTDGRPPSAVCREDDLPQGSEPALEWAKALLGEPEGVQSVFEGAA